MTSGLMSRTAPVTMAVASERKWTTEADVSTVRRSRPDGLPASASASLHGKMAAMRPPPPPPSRRALLSLDSATAISEFDDAYAIANLSYVSIPPSDDYVAPPTLSPTVPSDDATLDGATLRAGLSCVAGAGAAALSL